jgi:hypothetical protein
MVIVKGGGEMVEGKGGGERVLGIWYLVKGIWKCRKIRKKYKKGDALYSFRLCQGNH